MGHSVAAVVLAAGAGSRLSPLTRWRPKALCPVGNVALVDGAVARVAQVTDAVAVNLHHHAAQIDRHLPAWIHRSPEVPEPLGTAGAIGALRPWIDGRPVLVTNADAWFDAALDLRAFLAGWDGERTRLLCERRPGSGDFGDLRYCGVALLPAASAAALRPEPSGLYEVSWRHEAASGRLDLVLTDVAFVDCGTPADYLAANLRASGGASVIDPTATVAAGAVVERSVVWSGAAVRPGERLVDAIRTPHVTVLVRAVSG
jgi:N-acetyl-alpha-D-muramate 1-phosphate uridylyltransferase